MNNARGVAPHLVCVVPLLYSASLFFSLDTPQASTRPEDTDVLIELKDVHKVHRRYSCLGSPLAFFSGNTGTQRNVCLWSGEFLEGAAPGVQGPACRPRAAAAALRQLADVSGPRGRDPAQRFGSKKVLDGASFKIR